MTLERELKKIIGNVWFVRNSFKSIVKEDLVVWRSRSIQDIVQIMAAYDPDKEDFVDRLVLDNYLGSVQSYLTGYDLGSIHLSSKSLEVAFLFKVHSPLKDERCSSFGDLCQILIDRGLITQKGNITLAWKVVNRRNMTMHDAIP